MATAVSYAALLGYDLSGLRYARARPALSSVFLASFCGYAIGNAVGFGAFSGGAVRYRIYTAAGLSPGQIVRVILFISAALGIGLATIAGLGLVLCAHRVSRMLGTSPEPLFAAAAILLTVAMAFLHVLRNSAPTPCTIGPIELDPPGPALVLAQIGLTTIDVLAAAAALWVLLPPTGIGFVPYAAVYAAALGLGVLSHIPGGLGVFEVAILYAVGSKAPVSAVAAALVAYRAIYYLLPLFLSTILLAGFEARRFLGANTGERIGRAAGRLAPPFLAAATFAVGATLVTSGAMPSFTERLQLVAPACASLGGRNGASAGQHCRLGSALYRPRSLPSPRWRMVACLVDDRAQHSFLPRQRPRHHRPDRGRFAADRARRRSGAVRPSRLAIVAAADRRVADRHQLCRCRNDLDPVLRVPACRIQPSAMVAIRI